MTKKRPRFSKGFTNYLAWGRGAQGQSSKSQTEETSSSSELILSGNDVETSDIEEAVSRRSKSGNEDDNAGLESGSEEDVEADSELESGDSDAISGSESDFDSGVDRDSALESPPRKRTKRAS
ncbi:hypothetical protein CsSME_00028543 [Camellia sinensis var. sinensis]